MVADNKVYLIVEGEHPDKEFLDREINEPEDFERVIFLYDDEEEARERYNHFIESAYITRDRGLKLYEVVVNNDFHDKIDEFTDDDLEEIVFKEFSYDGVLSHEEVDSWGRNVNWVEGSYGENDEDTEVQPGETSSTLEKNDYKVDWKETMWGTV